MRKRVTKTVGVLSAYPEAGRRQSAIAYYVKTILEPLYGNAAEEVIIYADKAHASAGDSVSQICSNAFVHRCWYFGLRAPFQILRALLKSKIDVLHVEYDVYLYGGVVSALLLPFFLKIAAMARGFEIVATLHGVVAQRAVTREFLTENGFVLPYSRIGRFGFRVVYKLFGWACDRVIVLEQKLRRILIEDYGFKNDRVFVVPLPLMNERPRPAKSEAAERRGLGPGPVILFAGYASYYKGIDMLLQAFERVRMVRPDAQLHLVAGRHPRLMGNVKYEKFYASLQETAVRAGAIMYDFLPEDDLIDMLAAADVVVLPYTMAYGGSAALNTALAARRPVLVSSYVYFDGALPEQVFEPNARACADAIVRFLEDRSRIAASVEAQARAREVRQIALLNHRVRCGCNLDTYEQALHQLAQAFKTTDDHAALPT